MVSGSHTLSLLTRYFFSRWGPVAMLQAGSLFFLTFCRTGEGSLRHNFFIFLMKCKKPKIFHKVPEQVFRKKKKKAGK
jgi:hypothetical protein|uniref:Uncharacterized protein n=1 Tax=Desulfobacca acetoxidans TaxID=60893 RepID=A0A7V6DQQ4_9BACT